MTNLEYSLSIHSTCVFIYKNGWDMVGTVEWNGREQRWEAYRTTLPGLAKSIYGDYSLLIGSGESQQAGLLIFGMFIGNNPEWMARWSGDSVADPFGVSLGAYDKPGDEAYECQDKPI